MPQLVQRFATIHRCAAPQLQDRQDGARSSAAFLQMEGKRRGPSKFSIFLFGIFSKRPCEKGLDLFIMFFNIFVFYRSSTLRDIAAISQFPSSSFCQSITCVACGAVSCVDGWFSSSCNVSTMESKANRPASQVVPRNEAGFQQFSDAH